MRYENLPVIGRPVDNTALSAYMTCPREYYFSMVLGRRSKGSRTALSYGGLWHRILEAHYKTGGDLFRVMEAASKWEGDPPPPDEYRTPARAWLDYQKYLEEPWTGQKDLEATLGWPDRPMVEIPAAVPLGGFDPYAGKIDRIFKDSATSWAFVEDHKTTSRKDSFYFRQFETSNQMKGYVWLARQLVPSMKVVGVRINLCHITKTKTEFERQLITYSDQVIDEWYENTKRWLVRIHHDQLAQALEEGRSPTDLGLSDEFAEALLARGAFPGHYGDNGCSRKFGACQYEVVCSKSKRIWTKVLEQEFEVRPWNPLEVED